jgi:hypothetical protein
LANEQIELIVQVAGKLYGPLDLEQLGKLILNGDIHASDYVFLPDEKRWVMICEVENFASLIPDKPRFNVERPYIYTYELGQQMGPFTKFQFISRIQLGKLTPYDYVAFEGSSDWRRIREIESLMSYFPIPPDEEPSDEILPFWELEGKGDKLHPGSVSELIQSSSTISDDQVSREMMEEMNLYEVSPDVVWIVKEGETEFGPYNYLKIAELYRKGKVSDQAKVKKVNEARWKEITEVPELTSQIVKKVVQEGGVQVEKFYAKRRFPRIPFFNIAQVETSSGTESGSVTNLSQGGCFLESPFAWRTNVGEHIRLTILPGVFNKPMTIPCEVVGVIKKKPPGVCLKFIQLENEDSLAIDMYITKVLGRKASGEN